MTPMQKAEVVEMARGNDEHVVLAIGDGANDVAMLQVSFAQLTWLEILCSFALMQCFRSFR